MKVGAHPGRTLSPDLRSLSSSSEANLSYGSSSVFQEPKNTDTNLESPEKGPAEAKSADLESPPGTTGESRVEARVMD